jgi:hypothetical protein
VSVTIDANGQSIRKMEMFLGDGSLGVPKEIVAEEIFPLGNDREEESAVRQQVTEEVSAK